MVRTGHARVKWVINLYFILCFPSPLSHVRNVGLGGCWPQLKVVHVHACTSRSSVGEVLAIPWNNIKPSGRRPLDLSKGAAGEGCTNFWDGLISTRNLIRQQQIS